MSSQEIITLAVNADCEIIDYGDHYWVKKRLDVDIAVTIPKVPYLMSQLVEKIISMLNL